MFFGPRCAQLESALEMSRRSAPQLRPPYELCAAGDPFAPSKRPETAGRHGASGSRNAQWRAGAWGARAMRRADAPGGSAAVTPTRRGRSDGPRPRKRSLSPPGGSQTVSITDRNRKLTRSPHTRRLRSPKVKLSVTWG